MALARVALRRGARQGFGASLAAMLETVAIMGPARFGVPLTQAVTAPILGRLEARGTSQLWQVVVCGVLRLIHNTVTTAFFIWVIAGGLDAYSGTYERLVDRVGIALDSTGTLAITAIGLLVWAVFASTVQVIVYRRGLRDWPEEEHGDQVDEPPGERPAALRRRFDPRAVALAAALAFALLLAGTGWLLLGGIALWLALAWASARADRSVVPTGLAFTALLGGGAFIFTLGGGLGLDLARAPGAARRAARARGHLAARRRRRRRPARGVPAPARQAARHPRDERGGGGARPDRLGGPAAGARPAARSPPPCAMCQSGRWRSSTPCSPGWRAPRRASGPARRRRSRPGRAAARLGAGGARGGAGSGVLRRLERRAPAPRPAGCRRPPAAAAARAARGRPPGAAGSRGRRTGARRTAPRRGRRWPRARGWPSRTGWRPAPRRARAPTRSRRPGRAGELARRERVHVHHLLEAALLGAGGPVVAVAAGGGAHRRAPDRRQRVRAALGQLGDPVAVARGLAAEGDRAAGPQHAPELAEGALEVGQVVQHRVAEHEVEGVVGEGQRGRLAARGLHRQLEPGGRRLERLEHARRRCRWPPPRPPRRRAAG